MRLASCFIASIALHGIALVYPFLPRVSAVNDAIPVAVLVGSGEEPAQGPQGRGSASSSGGAMPAKAQPQSMRVKHLDAAKESVAQAISEAHPIPARAQESLPVSINGPAVTLAEDSGGVVHAGMSGSGNRGDVWGAGGEGLGGAGGGGMGNGIGAGTGSGGNSATFVQAGYRSTVKPDYPERARREGKEGQVLLRVLVDEAGRSKSIEINRSSGSDTLDHAAAEAIKRWRFSPARFGDKAVESWVKIPIEFRLKD
jgi:periplasmic protein TonB